MTAAAIHAAINANVEAFCSDAIDYATFTARQSFLHGEAERRGPRVRRSLSRLMLVDYRAGAA